VGELIHTPMQDFIHYILSKLQVNYSVKADYASRTNCLNWVQMPVLDSHRPRRDPHAGSSSALPLKDIGGEGSAHLSLSEGVLPPIVGRWVTYPQSRPQ